MFPTPIKAKANTATAICGQIAISRNGAPQSTMPTRNGAVSRLRPAMPTAATVPMHAADADGGVEPPDTGVAGVEHLDRDDDEQHGERSRDERLRSEEPDDDTRRSPFRGDRREADDDRLAEALLGVLVGLTVDLHARGRPEDARGREPEADRDEPEHGGRRRDGEEDAGDRGAEEEARSLDRRGDDVRRRQLLGPLDERREDRHLRGPEGSAGDSDADAQPVDDPVVRAREDRGGIATDRREPARVREEHHPRAWKRSPSTDANGVAIAAGTSRST